ncbi:MAG: hypothetical protein RIR41_421 [Pseudomonadota bacterium]|jgi:hypothetical protein
MNAFLLAAVSLGAILVTATRAPEQLVLGNEHRYAADDAEVARLMEEAPDAGGLAEIVFANPETGADTKVSMIAFRD